MAKKRVRRVGRQQTGGVYRPRVIVKFHDHVQLPYDRTAGARLAAIEPGAWGRLTQTYRGITLAPLFASKKAETLSALAERARATDPAYRPANLQAYFVIDVPQGASVEAIASEVRAWPSVATAYVEPPPVPPPVTPADDPRSTNQGYLDPARIPRDLDPN